MRTITPDELKTILENHRNWWDEDCEGWENMKADLSGADLSGADLSRADLRRAYLSGAKGITMACPSDGAFTAWKKLHNGAIAKLLIPENAKRSSATGRKCRCDRALVLAIYDRDGNAIESETSARTPGFVYKVGEHIVPDSFDDDRWNECSHGIHFFITRTEAEEYQG